MQRLCRPQSYLTHWSSDAIKDSASFHLSASQSRHPEIGSPWQFQVATSGSQRGTCFLTHIQRREKPLPLVLPFSLIGQLCYYGLLTVAGGWGADGLAEDGTSFPVPRVPGQVPEPNQDIVRKEELGNKAWVGTNSGHRSPQGCGSACARSRFSLVISLTLTTLILFYKLITHSTKSSPWTFRCASDSHFQPSADHLYLPLINRIQRVGEGYICPCVCLCVLPVHKWTTIPFISSSSILRFETFPISSLWNNLFWSNSICAEKLPEKFKVPLYLLLLVSPTGSILPHLHSLSLPPSVLPPLPLHSHTHTHTYRHIGITNDISVFMKLLRLSYRSNNSSSLNPVVCFSWKRDALLHNQLQYSEWGHWYRDSTIIQPTGPIYILPVLPKISFRFAPGSYPEVHVSSVSFIVEQFLRLLLCFLPFTVLRSSGIQLVGWPLIPHE